MRNGFGRTIALAFACCAMALFVFAGVRSASAVTWEKVASLGSGLDLCLDKDSVAAHADGLTYFSTKLCMVGDAQASLYAVQCNQDWSGDSIAIRARSQRPKADGTWLWLDETPKSASMIAIGAKTACGK
jgi:hypothetical protein